MATYNGKTATLDSNLYNRIKVAARERGASADVVDSILAAAAPELFTDPVKERATAHALYAARGLGFTDNSAQARALREAYEAGAKSVQRGY